VSPLARALLDELGPEDLAELAARLAPYLPTTMPADGDRWMATAEASAYLGITTTALHKLTAARAIPFEQEGPGCKCYFRRGDLDAWRSRR
jgi:hypothetical protein